MRMSLPAPDVAVEEVLSLLEDGGRTAYFGEPVTQLAHALQCAYLAREAGADDELILAALLHDVGHLVVSEDARHHDEVGVVNHDEVGAAWLRERGFSERLAALVGGHVDAKRFLTATRPEYAARLSPASTATLALQGGPMDGGEAETFRQDPLLRDKLRLRTWDEQAKVPCAPVAPLASYREMLLHHLQAG